MDKIVIEDNKILQTSIDIIDDKIIIDRPLELVVTIDNSKCNLYIEVLSGISATINVLSNNTCNQINYHLNKDSSLIINKLSTNNNDNIKIFLNGVNSRVEYFNSILLEVESNVGISIFNKSNDTFSNVISHAVNFSNNSLVITIDGNIDKGLINAKTYQDSQIINIKNGKNSILPLLFIDSNDVTANHASYIGKFKRDEVFYLQSRGLALVDCYKLLMKGFLLGKMKLVDEVKNVFIENINEWGDKIEEGRF